MFQITTLTTEPMMLTTQLPTWCCHQEDEDLSYSDDDEADSVHDPGVQENTEERLMSYNEFHKPEAVRSRDDLNDLDSRRVTILTNKDSVAYYEDEEESDDEDESDEEDKKAAQDCHLIHFVQVYSCHSVC